MRARRLIFRAMFNSIGLGRRAQEVLGEELRRSKNGSLGLVHRTGDDWLVECGDHLIWCSASDSLISAGLVKHGAWQRADFELAIATLQEHDRWAGGIFIDVGANIGTQSVYAGLRADISRVIALEPEPKNFDYLCRNIAINRLEDKAEAHRLAISDRAGHVHLAVSPKMQGMHSVCQGKSANSIAVDACRLDDLLHEKGIPVTDIALVWIDVEGHELAVFQGMAKILEARIPVFFEYGRGPMTDSWRALIEPHYAHAFVVHPNAVEKVGLDTALDMEFGDLLIF